MQVPILATKLYAPPPSADAVSRPRLTEKLSQGLARKLTVVCAPAGFGKTTVVREWLVMCDAPFAWLSLDEDDNNVTRFLTCVVKALQTVSGSIGQEVLEQLRTGPPDRVEPVLVTLLESVAAMSSDIVLVLEDYHATDSTAIDEALAFLLRNAPPHLHVVLTTREDPQLPLSRLRVRDQLTELRAADLRFTREEVAAFLNDVMELSLPTRDLVALEARTEGWIAGLKLAAVSLRGRSDAAEFVASFAGDNRYVVDYLVEEVLRQLPERTRRFLLETSILGDMCGTLCDAVTGSADGASMLIDLERSNLFVVPLDDKRKWFRYHHLFKDLLKAQLAERFPNEIPELHRRASAWYEVTNCPPESVRHALAGGDYVRVERLIERQGPAMRGRYQVATLLEWLGDVPHEVFAKRPVLALEHARALMDAGELEASDTRLREAEAWLTESEKVRTARGGLADDAAEAKAHESLRTRISIARAYLSQAHGDVDGTVRYAQEALDLMPESEPFERGVAGSLLGLAHWSQGRLEEAHEAFSGGLASMQQAGNLLVALSGTYILSDIRYAQGRLEEAIRAYERALERAMAEGGSDMVGVANFHLGLSELQWERGAWEEASRHWRASAELKEIASLPDTGDRWYLATARLQAVAGDIGAALASLEEAQRLHTRTPIPDVRPIEARKVRLWLAQGRLPPAVQWADTSGRSLDENVSYLREFELMTLARVHIKRHAAHRGDGNLAEVLDLLGRLLEAAQAGARMRSAIEVSLLQVLAHEAAGNMTLALVALERALSLAEPEEFVGVFLDEGDEMARLLTSAAAHGIRSKYVSRILQGFDGQHRWDYAPSQPSLPDQVDELIEPLTDKELEVLRLIAGGLSNRQICDRLYRALSTVKGYNRTIFAKLRVDRRTEAVARARELGLL